MCAAVSLEVRPENDTLMFIVLATLSTVMVATPVPGDAVAGFSLAPLSGAEKTMMDACAAGARQRTAVKSFKAIILSSIGDFIHWCETQTESISKLPLYRMGSLGEQTVQSGVARPIKDSLRILL
jgi:hypothetical protein